MRRLLSPKVTTCLHRDARRTLFHRSSAVFGFYNLRANDLALVSGASHCGPTRALQSEALPKRSSCRRPVSQRRRRRQRRRQARRSGFALGATCRRRPSCRGCSRSIRRNSSSRAWKGRCCCAPSSQRKKAFRQMLTVVKPSVPALMLPPLTQSVMALPPNSPQRRTGRSHHDDRCQLYPEPVTSFEVRPAAYAILYMAKIAPAVFHLGFHKHCGYHRGLPQVPAKGRPDACLRCPRVRNGSISARRFLPQPRRSGETCPV